MSDSLITRRGGGGASVKPADALLRISVPTGSTVVVSRAGVILSPNFYTVESTEDHLYFVIPHRIFSDTAWSITATRGTGATQESATDSVVINAPGEYDKTVLYDLVLFDWNKMTAAQMEAAFRSAGHGGQSYVHDVAGYIGLRYKTTNSSTKSWVIIQNIDLSSIRYNNLHFQAYASANNFVTVGLTVDPVDTTAQVDSSSFTVSSPVSTTATHIQLDISNISKMSHAKINVKTADNYNRTAYISKIWATQG